MSFQLTTLSILFGYCIFTSMALPITSKPIENTPEHLAWEEWLMSHPSDFQQNKTKKVTPKSIFLFRNKTTFANLQEIPCPPNHRFFDGKCIQTVEINRGQNLLNQLSNILQVDNQQTLDYDYDYPSEPEYSEDALPVASNSAADDQQPFKVQFSFDDLPNVSKFNGPAAPTSTAEFWQNFRNTQITTTGKSSDGIIASTSTSVLPPLAQTTTSRTIVQDINDLSDMEMSESDQTTKVVKDDLTSESNESTIDLKRQLAEESLLMLQQTTTTEETDITTTTLDPIASQDYFTEMLDDINERPSAGKKNLNIESTTIESSGDDEIIISTTFSSEDDVEKMTSEDSKKIINLYNESFGEQSTGSVDVKREKNIEEKLSENIVKKDESEATGMPEVPTIKLTDNETHLDPTASTQDENSKRFIYHNENDINEKSQKPIPLKFKARFMQDSTTTSRPTTTTTEQSTNDEDDDYWWLPTSWKLDQSSDKPLLLRFWSQLPSLYSS